MNMADDGDAYPSPWDVLPDWIDSPSEMIWKSVIFAAAVLMIGMVIVTYLERRYPPMVQLSPELLRARSIAAEVRAAHAEWEFDIEDRVFRRPLLGDVTEPLTASWLEALGTLNDRVPEDGMVTDSAACALDAANTAKDAWRAASAHAIEVGLGAVTDRDKETLRRAQRLLASAVDPATGDGERLTLLSKVSELIAQATHRPLAAVRPELDAQVDAHMLAIGADPLRVGIGSGTATEAVR